MLQREAAPRDGPRVVSGVLFRAPREAADAFRVRAREAAQADAEAAAKADIAKDPPAGEKPYQWRNLEMWEAILSRKPGNA